MPRYPTHIKSAVEQSERLGHKLVSQGCALFRCVICNRTRFLDCNTFFETCSAKPKGALL